MRTETEAKRESKQSDNVNKDPVDRSDNPGADLGLNEFIDIIRETNDEVLQVEELRTHTEELKEELIRYFTEIMEKYELEITIPGESFHSEDKNSDNLQTAFLNESGIVSYNFKDKSVKSYRLSDYKPSELMTIFSVVVPHLRDALKGKRKEYEEMSNRLSKIRKYLTFLKEKITNPQKQAALPLDKL